MPAKQLTLIPQRYLYENSESIRAYGLAKGGAKSPSLLVLMPRPTSASTSFTAAPTPWITGMPMSSVMRWHRSASAGTP